MAKRKVFIRSAYNYDADDVSRGTGLVTTGESVAIQSAKAECDINSIVARFGVTKLLPQAGELPRYEDFEGVFDYKSSMDAIASARESFDGLSAKVRARFNYDPQQLLEFCADRKNGDELIELGLAKRVVVPHTPVAPDVPAKEKGDVVGSNVAGAGKGAVAPKVSA